MTEKAGKNRSDYKRVNRGLVLKMVATGQCVTRLDLVRSTGLSKMAISNIVTELISQNLLVETETARSEEPGRRPVGLDLSPACRRSRRFLRSLLLFRLLRRSGHNKAKDVFLVKSLGRSHGHSTSRAISSSSSRR